MGKEAFIEFLAKSGAIKFGEFTLKSGRISPYFVNIGSICTGSESYELGKFFAQRINEVYKGDFDAVFGPAYKGIPMAVSISIALHRELNLDRPWLFDRKEMKRHGDAGAFVGAQLDLKSRVIIVDDVFTTGETKVEAIQKLEKVGLSVLGIVIAVDRQERGARLNAIEEFTQSTDVPVHSIVTIKEVFDYLKGRSVSMPDGSSRIFVSEKDYAKFMEYRNKHGV
jgi:orotate phosphoribosyltransferase